MRIATSVLCDTANVREGLLSILSAGISHLVRPEYPATVDATLAFIFTLESREDERASIRLTLASVGANDPDISPLEFEVETEKPARYPANIPVVVNVEAMPLSGPGSYFYRIDVNQVEAARVPFQAVLADAQLSSLTS